MILINMWKYYNMCSSLNIFRNVYKFASKNICCILITTINITIQLYK